MFVAETTVKTHVGRVFMKLGARDRIQAAIATPAEARRAIFRWINWHNFKRLHSSLNHTPPVTWEHQ